jgi:cyanophycin synthetase
MVKQSVEQPVEQSVEQPVQTQPVNARSSDAFDLFHFKHYSGPNPYLHCGALVFKFALSGNVDPLPLSTYQQELMSVYPHLAEQAADSYAELLAQTLIEVGKLDMDLHLQHWSVTPIGEELAIAIESIHEATSSGAAYAVWDWFEAITKEERFCIQDQIESLQRRFRRSVYGGPTVYALLRTAHQRGIPTFYLSEEGLMQYGYGRKQVRGIATTFNTDSHLDSDFTTRKDDCKDFLDRLGFPVPQGDIVASLREAIATAHRVGYPVAVKPVVGHKGIGVTAGVENDDELEFAYDRAVDAHPEDQPIRVIVEQSISGSDFRLLCVDGKFVAAMERRPASVVGDGQSTIQDLIDRENQKPERRDTPTSPLGQIIGDDAMRRYLAEQSLDLNSILKEGREVFLRKVANLSSGGVGIDATPIVHPDNVVLAQDIAQHFQLVCLGIDVLTPDISRSWKERQFGVIEINSAPGVYMHLRPAVGEAVEVTARILDTFFEKTEDARIPILTFNYLPLDELRDLIDRILIKHPTWVIGAVVREGVMINRTEKRLNSNHNSKVQSLLRHPKLDLLIAEYDEPILQREGLFYDKSNVVILDNPTEVEMTLARDVFENTPVVIKQDREISIRNQGLIEQYTLGEHESFYRVYWKEISAVL